jgi:small redox-active disulfide protein 2
MKDIKVLGSEGCKTCTNLKTNIEELVSSNKLEANVEKITDIEQIMQMGVMSNPAVVIDGKVKCSGRIPTSKELLDWLK